MDYAKESLRLHYDWNGKIEVISKVPVKTSEDLSLAYTPGVAQPCLEIQKDINKSYDMLAGADIFIGVSAPKAVTTDMVRTMNKDAIIFACANPTPEILPDEAKAGGARVVATGRSDFPNQVNNVLAFPGIFRGTFDVRAKDINDEMKMAAALALAGLISDQELNENHIIPEAFDPRVGKAVATAVAEAARKSGVARI